VVAAQIIWLLASVFGAPAVPAVEAAAQLTVRAIAQTC